MEKKLLYTLLCSLLSLFGSHLFGETVSGTAFAPTTQDTCFAPPPDSFRITGFGYGYVSLAWNPISAGADHLVTVFQENNNNGYDSLFSILYPNSVECTISNLNPEKRHVFTIRTVCGNGLVSRKKSFPPLGPTGLILDLTTLGRTPNNPTNIDCKGMRCPTAPNEWIGFRISEIKNAEVVNSTIFEFDPTEEPGDVAGTVKRATNLGESVVLVAANLENEWPKGATDIVQAKLRFKAGKIIGPEELEVIGYLEVSFNLGGPQLTVDICDDSWSPGFTYESMEGTAFSQECHGCLPDLELSRPLNTKGLIKVQNPCAEFLYVFFPESGFQSGRRHFELLNLNGVPVLKADIDVPYPIIAIPINYIPFGFYVLRIEHNGDEQKIKVILSQ